jgi:hypothetical protein
MAATSYQGPGQRRREPPKAASDAAHPRRSAPRPSTEGLARSRAMLERIAGTVFPASLSDEDALQVGTGRCAPTDEQTAHLGELAERLPFILG